MINRELLIPQIEAFEVLEAKAESDYQNLLRFLVDPEHKRIVTEIAEDEARHALICREVITYLEDAS